MMPFTPTLLAGIAFGVALSELPRQHLSMVTFWLALLVGAGLLVYAFALAERTVDILGDADEDRRDD